jgi:hypothetical protein
VGEIHHRFIFSTFGAPLQPQAKKDINYYKTGADEIHALSSPLWELLGWGRIT